MQGEADGARRDWREVSVQAYRTWTSVSSVLGVLLLAWGIWELAHARFITGPLLIVLGFFAGLWTLALRIEGEPGVFHEAVRGRPGPGREQWAPRVLHFYTRRDCTLCDEAKARLEPVLQKKGITLVSHDVDEDKVLKRRYGARVPVALYQGDEVFALQFDEEAVGVLR